MSATKLRLLLLTLLLLGLGCDRKPIQRRSDGGPGGSAVQLSLLEARRGFQTKLVSRDGADEPVAQPPANQFRIVKYPSSVGALPAYLSAAPADGRKHPAIIWITGGDCNSIGDVWSPAPPENDQTASAFRQAGIIMMYPSLRGGNGGPGKREGFFGEVDDVIAAAEFLASQPSVDPQRIYLGGHSTGGTLVMLVAAASPRFRAVFSFGPVDDVGGYGSEYLPFDASNPREVELRSPGRWVNSIQSPTFVFEGAQPRSNIESLRTLEQASQNPRVHFAGVQGASHFSILQPVTRLIAGKIIADTGAELNIAFAEEEFSRLFK
ncbi:MAG: Alpha/beta hydrolase family protein [Phycisphaerales bacterium]|nr:Alpha/beta hydrolase family protein [Phycisphaerales bacterium]